MIKKQPRVYLDLINSAPLSEEVITAMTLALRQLGNPSSLHSEGRHARLMLENARARVASLIHAGPAEIFFTSSGTEANHWALRGLAQAHVSRGRQIIVSAIEHVSVLHAVRQMEKEGWRVTFIPVDKTGQVVLDALQKAVTSETVLVSLQWANGEIGTIQQMRQLIDFLKNKNILVHTDAAAAVGSISVNVHTIPVDALSISSYGFGGPAGAGALYVKKGVRIAPFLVGGFQEEGRRAGAENMAGIVGMGEAARQAAERLSRQTEISAWRDDLIQELKRNIARVYLNGHSVERVPNHVSMTFPGVDAESLIFSCDIDGVAIGLGSACTLKTMKASHVLKAIGLSDEEALGTVTCTWDSSVTKAQIDYAAHVLVHSLSKQLKTTDAPAFTAS